MTNAMVWVKAQDWIRAHADEYRNEEPVELAIDATAEFDLWDKESCSGSWSVPLILLELAESLVPVTKEKE